MGPFATFGMETPHRVTAKKAWDLLAEIRHNSALGFATRKAGTREENERALKTLGLIREVASGDRITGTGRQLLKERRKSVR